MSKRAPFLLLPIIYLGFISLGLPDGVFGVAWPHMQSELRLPFDLAGQLMLVLTLLAMSSSFLSGVIIQRFKTGPVVLVSCVLTGTSLILVSHTTSTLWLVLASLPLGLGAGAVDSGLNGFVARHYSRRHMNWLHACWGIGATCGPFLMTSSLSLGHGWNGGFMVIGLAQLCLALVFLLSLGLWRHQPETKPDDSSISATATRQGTLSARSTAGYLSAFIYAVYVAVEGSVGLWGNSILVLSRHIPQETAGLCVTAYYGSITTGRILMGFAPSRWNTRRLISGGLLLALAGALLFIFSHSGALALPAMVMLGLGFAPVFPGLMHEVPNRFVSQDVQTMVGRQSACAYFGAAFAPPVVGWLAVQLGLEITPILILGGTLLLALCIFALNRLGRPKS